MEGDVTDSNCDDENHMPFGDGEFLAEDPHSPLSDSIFEGLISQLLTGPQYGSVEASHEPALSVSPHVVQTAQISEMPPIDEQDLSGQLEQDDSHEDLCVKLWICSFTNPAEVELVADVCCCEDPIDAERRAFRMISQPFGTLKLIMCPLPPSKDATSDIEARIRDIQAHFSSTTKIYSDWKGKPQSRTNGSAVKIRFNYRGRTFKGELRGRLIGERPSFKDQLRYRVGWAGLKEANSSEVEPSLLVFAAEAAAQSRKRKWAWDDLANGSPSKKPAL